MSTDAPRLLPETQTRRDKVGDADGRLVEDCLCGRIEAFGELAARHQARLFRAAVRMTGGHEDAADVVQDTFLSAYQSLRSFRGDASFFTWIYRIAFNCAANQKRRGRVPAWAGAADGRAGPDPADPSESARPGARLERDEARAELRVALGGLSGEHREVLALKDVEGMRYVEIAGVLGVPVGTVRSRLHRARLELRDRLRLREVEAATMTQPGRGDRRYCEGSSAGRE